MARFKVYHIVRDGHVQRDVIHAKNRRLATEEAKNRFDDVLKVKRDSSPPQGLILLVVAAVIALALAWAK